MDVTLVESPGYWLEKSPDLCLLLASTAPSAPPVVKRRVVKLPILSQTILFGKGFSPTKSTRAGL